MRINRNMYKKNKHIIISWLLISVILIPSVWQLEHVFNNNHGIVYRHNHFDFSQVSDAYCAVFHKQLQFNTLVNTFVFKVKEPVFFNLINDFLPAPVPVFKLRHFALRAPPIFV